MAEGVDTQLALLQPIAPAPAKSLPGKAETGAGGAFSSVLDQQRRPAPGDGEDAGSRIADAGKRLPQRQSDAAGAPAKAREPGDPPNDAIDDQGRTPGDGAVSTGVAAGQQDAPATPGAATTANSPGSASQAGELPAVAAAGPATVTGSSVAADRLPILTLPGTGALRGTGQEQVAGTTGSPVVEALASTTQAGGTAPGGKDPVSPFSSGSPFPGRGMEAGTPAAGAAQSDGEALTAVLARAPDGRGSAMATDTARAPVTSPPVAGEVLENAPELRRSTGNVPLPGAGNAIAAGIRDAGSSTAAPGADTGPARALDALSGERSAGTSRAAENLEALLASAPQARVAAPAVAATDGAATGQPLAAPLGSAAAAPSTAMAADGADSASLAMRSAPSDPAFGEEMVARMQTLVRDGVREARLQLHPAELGRLHVTITTDGDQARVLFVADSTAARDAIEQAMPRLREALQQAGLQLAQSDVGQRDAGSTAGDGAPGDARSAAGRAAGIVDAGDSELSPEALLSHLHTGDGRIDTYI